MKKEWIEQLSQVDDFYLEEANPFSKNKKKKWYQSKALIAGIACAIILGGIMMFVPYRTTAMVLYRIFDPEHYNLIMKIDEVIDEGSANLSSGTHILQFLTENGNQEQTNNLGGINIGSLMGAASSYEEITDNQVDGIIEADLIKRSDKCLFYLYDTTLYTYSIEQENSKPLDSYELWMEPELGTNDIPLSYPIDCEFYLSEDCNTATIILRYYDDAHNPWVDVITLNVSDPGNITKVNTMKTSGYYITSRLTDGNLLLITKYVKTSRYINFLDSSTFLPQTITEDGKHFITAESIAYPETIDSFQYVVVQLLDEKTLKIKDNFAFLSYSADNIYVSDNYIYTTHDYTSSIKEESLINHDIATEISCLSYSKDRLEYKGKTMVSGYLENQYSMDEYDGIFRIVTTLEGFSYVPVEKDGKINVTEYKEYKNAALSCIDVDTLSVVAEVKFFAPEGENVESVRFDEDRAYVCTALTVENTDPVFVFDLSDLDNITYEDTGIIDGYSSSLVDLSDDYLLGIGVGANDDIFKVEIYKEEADFVKSVCSYELENVYFSTSYKSYYIDRDNNLFGFGINPYSETEEQYYVLLHFSNNELSEVAKTPLSGGPSNMRAVYIDKYLYMFGENGQLIVKEVNIR